MVKGVIFDLDHTLFDRYATLTATVPYFYEKLKDKMAPGLGMEDLLVNIIYADKTHISYGWGRVAEYLNETGFFTTPVTEEEITDTIHYAFTKDAIPYDFTYEVLYKLRSQGYKVGLITNGTSKVQRKKLELLEISDCFDEIVISGEVGVRKPDTAIFDIMAQRLGIPANELLYVGDNPINDVDASRQAGYIPVWVRAYPWHCPEIEKCELQIDDVSHIFEILEQLK